MSHHKDLVNVILGNPYPLFEDKADLEYGQKFLDVFKSHGFLDIDTARVYFHGEKVKLSFILFIFHYLIFYSLLCFCFNCGIRIWDF